jgi:hypothetical protein
METLEYFLLNPGWSHTWTIRLSPELSSVVMGEEESHAIQMRILRYSRQGLLERRKSSGHRGFEYSITIKGEDRLFYLWEKMGKTRAEDNMTEEEKQTSKILNELKLKALKSRLRPMIGEEKVL